MLEITDIPSTTATPHRKRTSSAAQAGAIGRGLINLALMIFTIRDIRRRSDDEIKGNRKFWMLAAFAPPIGPIAYFLFGRKRDTPTDNSPLDTIE